MHLTFWRLAPSMGLAALLFTGCYVKTKVVVKEGDWVELKDTVISIDSGARPELVEAMVTQMVNFISERDSFKVARYLPNDQAVMENYLLVRPVKQLSIRSMSQGDRLSISRRKDGNRELEWTLEPRIRGFASELLTDSKDTRESVFFIIEIAFPGAIVQANTPEVRDNVGTWSILKAQLVKSFGITAIYRPKGAVFKPKDDGEVAPREFQDDEPITEEADPGV